MKWPVQALRCKMAGSMRRALAVLALGAFCAGCPGNLDRRERFIMDAGADCSDVENTIFKPACGGSGCHENPGAASNLDLVSTGVKARLATLSTCQSKPMKSYMLEKVSATPGCGQPMPFNSDPLTTAELKCLTDYMATVTLPDGGM